jgi:hypothetical protein
MTDLLSRDEALAVSLAQLESGEWAEFADGRLAFARFDLVGDRNEVRADVLRALMEAPYAI